MSAHEHGAELCVPAHGPGCASHEGGFFLCCCGLNQMHDRIDQARAAVQGALVRRREGQAVDITIPAALWDAVARDFERPDAEPEPF